MIRPCLFLLLLNALAAEDTVRDERLIASGWRFTTGDTAQAQDPACDDRDWQEVDLPHDWAIAAPYDRTMPQGGAQGYLRRWQVGWYRLHLDGALVPAGRRAWVRFDGVYRDSEVWINGVSLGKRPNGYATFHYDLTPHWRPAGDNVLAVRVDNSRPPADRWYSGAGIYRRVWLTTTSPVAVAPWGVVVTTPKAEADGAAVAVRITVANQGTEAATVEATTIIAAPDGGEAGRVSTAGTVPAGGTIELTGQAEVPHPRRWSPDDPALYQARTTVRCGNTAIDAVTTPFGIRSLRFSADKGFELNGVTTKMKGVCIHHDAGCLGAAYFPRAWERRLEGLKAMGCNAIRTSHNAPDPDLLDQCDRLGFLVVDEAFDKWQWKDGWYTPHFDTWAQRDLGDLVRRDRNHPSVVVWSVGNEVTEQQDLAAMERMLPPLVACVKALDTTRPVTLALEPHCNPRALWDAPVAEKVRRTLAIARHLDILGLNYHEQWYDDYLRADPRLVILGTENYGHYRGRDNAFWAFDEHNPWFDVASRPAVVSQFLWTGIDYLGEARGWPVKGSTASPMDTTGHLKPRAYFHQSVWSAQPMVRIAPFHEQEPSQMENHHWSWPKLADHWNLEVPVGDMVRVATFSNCEEVALDLDGTSYGRQRPDQAPNRTVIWNVPYKPGVLTAHGFNGGTQVAEHQLRTAGAPARLMVRCDRTTLAVDGQDLCHVAVAVVDGQGTVVPTASPRIGFEVVGPARLIGVDNGDLTGDEPYQAVGRSAWRGRCLGVVRAGRRAGTATIAVTARDLPTVTVDITCR